MSILMKQECPKQESKDVPGRKALFFLKPWYSNSYTLSSILQSEIAL